ncbi:MAG: peptide deformylase [Alphaproteobacteria bacterium]|jgi:peptide deformylase|nr:peptide deformylase [Alphaproteobacteria bacterium]
MAKLSIRIAPDPVLKARAEPVAGVDARITRLMDDMLETMYEAPGVGLAAPQVGVLERVIVVDIAGKDEPAQPLCLANPEVVWVSDEKHTYNEGCLSFPDQYADVTRPAQCRVRYLDRSGAPQEVEAAGLLATCLQHEIDHLDGILFTDHISPLKRNIIMRKLTKWKKSQAA